MTITVDTNILVRIAVEDDPTQVPQAKALVSGDEPIVITAQALCEFVWVLSSAYKLPRSEIADAIRALIDVDNVVSDRGMVDVGLAMLDRGGDFADGVIVAEGLGLGATSFASFDRKAVRLAAEAGFAVRPMR